MQSGEMKMDLSVSIKRAYWASYAHKTKSGLICDAKVNKSDSASGMSNKWRSMGEVCSFCWLYKTSTESLRLNMITNFTASSAKISAYLSNNC